MIVFDLACRSGHRFEAWFGSSADFEDQKARGLLVCPLCEDAVVDKAVMAPAVASKSNSRGASGASRETEGDGPAVTCEGLRALRADIEAHCDDVGRRFAEEARARFGPDAPDGSDAPRGIIGQATMGEAVDLWRDGIPVAPLPFRPKSATDA